MLSSAHADIILVACITWTLVNKHISGPLHAFVSMRHTFHFQGGIQVISSPLDVIWFWTMSVQILLVQATPTGRASSEGEIGSGPGSGLCARFTNPWHSPLPQFAWVPFQERNWEIWQTRLSILKAWSEPEPVTILIRGNPIDMNSLTFFNWRSGDHLKNRPCWLR